MKRCRVQFFDVVTFLDFVANHSTRSGTLRESLTDPCLTESIFFLAKGKFEDARDILVDLKNTWTSAMKVS